MILAYSSMSPYKFKYLLWTPEYLQAWQNFLFMDNNLIMNSIFYLSLQLVSCRISWVEICQLFVYVIKHNRW